jgi:undecaprenyl-diphosphatase
LWLCLIIGTIPAGLTGFVVRDFVKSTLFNPVTVAVALIVGGIILIWVERRGFGQSADSSASTDLSTVTLRQALLIGIAQITALIPGVSRAAASIIAGMVVGLNRQTATRFSFYLAIPTLGGATTFDLLLSLDELQGSDLVYLVAGAVVSGIVAWFAIGWLLRYVAGHTFVQFGFYRVIAGIVILILAALSLL